MLTDLTLIARVMRDNLRNLVEEGEAEPDADGDLRWQDVFPFAASAVVGVHTHRIGDGDGVWYRLDDGRVFSRFGEEVDADPALYDTVDN